MLQTAEYVAKTYGISREQQDQYGVRSQQRAAAARDAGLFNDEIAPMAAKNVHIARRHRFSRSPRKRVDQAGPRTASVRDTHVHGMARMDTARRHIILHDFVVSEIDRPCPTRGLAQRSR